MVKLIVEEWYWESFEKVPLEKAMGEFLRCWFVKKKFSMQRKRMLSAVESRSDVKKQVKNVDKN